MTDREQREGALVTRVVLISAIPALAAESLVGAWVGPFTGTCTQYAAATTVMIGTFVVTWLILLIFAVIAVKVAYRAIHVVNETG